MGVEWLHVSRMMDANAKWNSESAIMDITHMGVV